MVVVVVVVVVTRGPETEKSFMEAEGSGKRKTERKKKAVRTGAKVGAKVGAKGLHTSAACSIGKRSLTLPTYLSPQLSPHRQRASSRTMKSFALA